MMAVVNSVDKKEQKVKKVFKVVLEQDGSKGFVASAQAYAAEGLRITCKEALIVQARYVLVNLQYWRGEEARRCKKVLKEYAK